MDGLTGLATIEELAAALPSGSAPVVYVDVDALIWFNDCNGHEAGDAALARLASGMRARTVALGGLAGRIGGDDFVLLLPGRTREEARALAAQVRADVDVLALRHTKSAGSSCPYESISVSTLVCTLEAERLSDRAGLCADLQYAMYLAKRGRQQRARLDAEVIRELARTPGSRSLSERRSTSMPNLWPWFGMSTRDAFLAHFADGQLSAHEPGWALVVDMDNLRRANDEFSLSGGDLLLEPTALCVRDSVPPHARAARIGGDEFAIWLPNAARAEALELAERIRTAVGRVRIDPERAKHRLDHFEELVRFAPSVSVGVAPRLPQDRRGHDVLDRAEHALHEAKQLGRDRVALCEQRLPWQLAAKLDA